MSLKEMIIKVQHDYGFPVEVCKIEKILKNDPKTVENLDRKTATILLRYAVRFQRYSFINEQVTILADQHMINANLLDLAFFRGDLQLIELLLKNGAKLDGPDWIDFSPANYVFYKNNSKLYKDMMLLLLKYGFNPGSLNEHGQNSLHLLTQSVTEEDTDAVKLAEILIKAGASINKASLYQMTPLHYSISRNNFELASFLVERGADIHQKGKPKSFPLAMAVERRCKRIVELLVAKGADVNTKNLLRQTTLHLACEKQGIKQDIKIINFLIQNGADVTLEDKFGWTPFLLLLSSDDDDSNKFVIRIISKLRFQSILVSKKDIECIQKNENFREYYEKCLTELEQMSNAKFYAFYTYFWILKMPKISRKSHKKWDIFRKI